MENLVRLKKMMLYIDCNDQLYINFKESFVPHIIDFNILYFKDFNVEYLFCELLKNLEKERYSLDIFLSDASLFLIIEDLKIIEEFLSVMIPFDKDCWDKQCKKFIKLCIDLLNERYFVEIKNKKVFISNTGLCEDKDNITVLSKKAIECFRTHKCSNDMMKIFTKLYYKNLIDKCYFEEVIKTWSDLESFNRIIEEF